MAEEVKTKKANSGNIKVLRETIARLKQENIDLGNQIDKMERDIDKIVAEKIKERIVEKERYITQVETECDDRIANANLVRIGLEGNLAKARKRIEELERDLILERRRNGNIFSRLFGKKDGLR